MPYGPAHQTCCHVLGLERMSLRLLLHRVPIPVQGVSLQNLNTRHPSRYHDRDLASIAYLAGAYSATDLAHAFLTQLLLAYCHL